MKQSKPKQPKNGGLHEALQGAESLIEQVQREYKPRDYSEWEVKELIALLRLDEIWGIQCTLKIVCPNTPPTDELCQKAFFIANHLTPEDLVALALSHPDTRPLVFLLETKLHKNHIGGEIHNRLSKRKTGFEMLRLEAGASEGTKDLDKLLLRAMAQKKMPGLRKRENPEDLMQKAREVAFEHKRELSQTARVKLPEKVLVPPLPPTLGLPQDNPPGWDEYFSDLLARTFEQGLRGLMPVAEGALERVYKKVTQAFGNLEDYWKAQMRTGEEVGLEEADRTRLRRSRSGIWRKKGERVEEEDKPDISERMFEVLRIAKQYKRWGDKAVKAFMYYVEGKTEKEAAKLTGITDKTFRNYITRFQKICASKK